MAAPDHVTIAVLFPQSWAAAVLDRDYIIATEVRDAMDRVEAANPGLSIVCATRDAPNEEHVTTYPRLVIANNGVIMLTVYGNPVQSPVPSALLDEARADIARECEKLARQFGTR